MCTTMPPAGIAEVRLEVLVVVPGEGADAVAVAEAEPSQRGREPRRPLEQVGVGVAVEALVGQPADDLLVPEVLLRAAQDRRHVQLVVHDQAVHSAPPCAVEQGVRDLRAQLRGGRLESLDPLRALVQPVQHVLPGEADPAVDLDRALAGGDGGLGGLRLRGRRGDRRVRLALGDAPRGPVARASAPARARCTSSRAGARPPGRRRSCGRTGRASRRTRSRARARARRRRRPPSPAARAAVRAGGAARSSRRAGGRARRRPRRRAAGSRPSSRARFARPVELVDPVAADDRHVGWRRRARRSARRARASSSPRRRRPRPASSAGSAGRSAVVVSHGAGGERAAELLGDRRLLEEAEAGAAVLLGDGDAGPAELRELRPASAPGSRRGTRARRCGAPAARR